MKYGHITFTDLKGVWRIIAAVAACQLLGGAISLALSIHHFWFSNLWLGGAAGTLPGLALGIVWQFKAGSDRGWIGMACFLGLLAVAVTGIAFGVAFPRMRSNMQNLGGIAQLQSEALEQIDVFDRYGRDRIVRITDTESLTTFARGIADAVGHSPNHPRYSHSWYVVVNGTRRHEFELHFNPRFPERVIGYCVVKTGNSTSYHGTFESKDLRPWVETHLMKGDANERVEATQ